MRPRRVYARLAALTRRDGERPQAAGAALLREAPPLDLRVVGRMLLQASLLGAAAGVIGVLFSVALEHLQHLLLETLAGYTILRAAGEASPPERAAGPYRPLLLALLPALGGLAAGLVLRFAPEARGGGGDPMIDAFHRRGAYFRPRVVAVKGVATLLTLGSGGAGGRAGPTMQVGAALGSLISDLFGVGPRERRVLFVAGVAAGLSAVLRTPLGAALLAVEVLYRDGFESDALIPAVFSSVVGYSVVTITLGDPALLLQGARYPFTPAHLPLYLALAVLVAGLARLFIATLGLSRRGFAALPFPEWTRPALGGLGTGLLAVGAIGLLAAQVGREGQGLGLLGSGFGAAQLAIGGVQWLPGGWLGVLLLLSLALAKIAATALTLGSGGSGGHVGPSLTIGALAGGAFGRALLLLGVEGVAPGAFALVGMAAFYGGAAHVPLSALVMVCELVGNYDLLVPLMLALGVAFLMLRQVSLYEAQAPSPAEAAEARATRVLGRLRGRRVAEVMRRTDAYVRFRPDTPAPELIHHIGASTGQAVFPVVDDRGRMVGLVCDEALRRFSRARGTLHRMSAADFAAPPVRVRPEEDLGAAAERLLGHALREVPVIDADDAIVGFLDQAEVTRFYLRSLASEEEPRP